VTRRALEPRHLRDDAALEAGVRRHRTM